MEDKDTTTTLKNKIILISSIIAIVLIIAVIVCLTVFGKDKGETSNNETSTPTAEVETTEKDVIPETSTVPETTSQSQTEPTSEEVEKILYEKYEDTEKNGSGAEVEIPTAAPNETQPETIEIEVNDEMKEVAFDDNWSEWIQLQNGVFVYKQATGVLYYWGSDIDAVDWENPIVANRLVPTEQLVTISTGTETISSVNSTDNSNNGNSSNSSNSSDTSNTDSSSPQREEGHFEIDPSDDTAEEWGGIVFNP